VSHDALVGYLARTGWTQGEPGVYGALWTIGRAEPVGVTHSSDSDSPDWEDLLRRIAVAIADSPAAVRADLALEMSTLTQRGPK
jgi:hypothetical protein